MDENGVVETIDQAKSWFINHQDLLIQYAVNIVSALVILFAGLIVARWISHITNRLMSLRGIDKTVRDFYRQLCVMALLHLP